MCLARADLLLREGSCFPNKFSFKLSSKDLSVAFVNMVSSSRMANGHQTHGLFHTVDGRLEIHPKVDHLPLDALSDVLLLLQHEPVKKFVFIT